MKILITGFEPFGGSHLNPSQRVVQTLSSGKHNGISLVTAVLPVDHVRGPGELLEAVGAENPDVVICLGEASGRSSISIERVAVNLLDFRIPDNRGDKLVDKPVQPDGPAAYFVTLPVRRVLSAVQHAGVPAELSLSAGSFLCNQVLYELLHYLHINEKTIPAGFIHLPALPEQTAARQACEEGRVRTASMSLETMVKGIQAVIESLRKP